MCKKEGAENNSAPPRNVHHDEKRDSDGNSDPINVQLERRREAAKRLPPLRCGRRDPWIRRTR